MMALLQPYQTIKVQGPKGNFFYTRNMVKKLGMIAGGTGITPMLQIINAIVRDPEDVTEVSLVFANVTLEDIILKDEIDELAEKYYNFKVHYVLNDEPKDPWDGSIGYVTPEIISKYLPTASTSDDYKILICGPPPMVSAMRTAVEVAGHEKPRVVSKLEDRVFLF
jgi:cytochrome-b5 reductase